MRIDVQRILMKPPIVYMNEGHSFCVFLFNYESNKLFNDFLLLDLVIFCNIIFELNFRNYRTPRKILMLKFDIKHFFE